AVAPRAHVDHALCRAAGERAHHRHAVHDPHRRPHLRGVRQHHDDACRPQGVRHALQRGADRGGGGHLRDLRDPRHRHGRAVDDPAHDPGLLSGDRAPGLRPDLVRDHHRVRGGDRAHQPARRHEHVRPAHAHPRAEHGHHLQRRAAVHVGRRAAAGDPRGVPDPLAVAAQLHAMTDDVGRPTVVEVSLARLAENYRAIAAAVAPAAVMPILKANAYGHGMIAVARHLAGLGVTSFGVAFLEEAVALREAGITVPILVMGGILGDQIPIFLRHGLTLTASSVDKLRAIDDAARELGVRAKVHLKIDTGMERIGVHWYSAEKLLERTGDGRHSDVEGIYSHFANADAADLGSARVQLERFLEVLQWYDKHGVRPPVRHMANSGAILQLPESYLDLVRPGILLYGVYPSTDVRKTIAVRPALSWKSRVVYFKVVKPGHPVSYGSTWQSDHQVRIVTIPVGYGDGYFRALSNTAQVLIRGKKYPVVGRVCMDQIMVNIEWDTAYNGDPVTLLGADGDALITCEDVAGWANTIPYEVLTNINTRVPRVYV